MKGKIRSIIFVLALLGLIFGIGDPSFAIPTLLLSDNFGHTGSATDSDGDGLVTFVGSIGNWTLNVTGSIDPLIDPVAARLALTSVSMSGSNEGNLAIQFLATDFSMNGNLYFQVSGSLNAPAGSNVAFQSMLGDMNQGYHLIASLGPFGPGVFSDQILGYADAKVPTLLTTEAFIDYQGSGVGTFDASVQPVPEPATLLLLGSGLLGTGVFGRKKLRKSKA